MAGDLEAWVVLGRGAGTGSRRCLARACSLVVSPFHGGTERGRGRELHGACRVVVCVIVAVV